MSKVFFRKSATTMSIACLAGILSLPIAKAGIIPNMSGNHRAIAESRPDFEQTVNFAVFKRDGVIKGDVFGTGYTGFDSVFMRGINSIGLDVRAKYLYLYQVVNDGEGYDYSVDSAVPVPKSSVTSWGSWNLALRDNRGVVGVRNRFGSDLAKFTPAAPANTTVSSPGIQTSQNLEQPTLKMRYYSSYDEVNIFYQFRLNNGETSRIIGFTSNVRPWMYAPSLEQSADNWAIGAIPIPDPYYTPYRLQGLTGQIDAVSNVVPEPTSVTLATLCIGGFAVLYCRWERSIGPHPQKIQ